ncbi:6-phosphogluconolactonase [Aureococcus anophagefferens]|nr:6-phosphogluconolactonase [Aureococcus anophagefferens]
MRLRVAVFLCLAAGAARADDDATPAPTPQPTVSCASVSFDSQWVITTLADGAKNCFATDVDGDGDVDVVGASASDTTMAWYENDGSESFRAAALLHEARAPHMGHGRALRRRAGDLDGDGDVDVVAALWELDTFSIFYNDGGQAFTESIVATGAANDVPDFETSDLGRVPLVTTLADGASMVVVADVDGDGDNDLVASAYNGAEVFWYEQRNIDAATVYTGRLIKNNVDAVESVFPTDVDGDGDVDVVAAWSGEDAVAWYESDGSESFTELIITTLADLVRSAVAADLDGDGDVDVASASQDDDTVAWYENDGAQSFTRHVLTTLADYAGGSARGAGGLGGATRAPQVFAIDVDGDGDVDVLSASYNDDTVAWYENDCATHAPTTLAPTTPFPTPRDTGVSRDAVHAVDVDGDGDVDALSASSNDDTVAWYENDGAQSFTERIITTLADGVLTVYAIDVDGDGDVDALAGSSYDYTVAWHENDGSQSFTERVITTNAEQDSSQFAFGIFAIDVDWDGDVDALSASVGADLVAWYENDGSQSFAARVITTERDYPVGIFAFDVDGDGDVDALSTSSSDDTVAWYENDGYQSFTAFAITSSLGYAYDVFAIDVDADGDADVLAAGPTYDTAAWYENDGSASFAERVITSLADDGAGKG